MLQTGGATSHNWQEKMFDKQQKQEEEKHKPSRGRGGKESEEAETAPQERGEVRRRVEKEPQLQTQGQPLSPSALTRGERDTTHNRRGPVYNTNTHTFINTEQQTRTFSRR